MNKNNENDLLIFVSASCLSVLLVTFILTLFNVIDFRIINDVELPVWINFCGNLIMFMANMFFVFSITLKIFDKRIIKLLIGYIPIVIISQFTPVEYMTISAALIPFLYLLVLNKCIFKSNIFNVILRYALWSLVILIYFKLSGFVKLQLLGLDLKYFTFNNILSSFIYSIDLYVVYVLIYKGVKNNVQMVDWRFRWIVKLCKTVLKRQPNEYMKDVSMLTKKQRRIFYMLLYSFNLGIFGIITLFGTFNLGLWEILIMISVFFIDRKILGKTFHSKRLMICGAITISSFYILSKISLPLNISLFTGIGLIAIFTYMLYRVGYILMPDPFKCKSATEEEMKERCKHLGFRKDKTELAIKAFVLNIPRKELLIDEYDTIGNVNSRISKLKKLLEAPPK